MTGLHAILPHRLHVAELVQAKVGKLAAKAAFLHAPEGHARIAGAIAVDKHPAALQFAREGIRKRSVSGKDGGGQAKVAVVGKRQGVRRVFRDGNGRDRTKQLWRNAVIDGVTFVRTVGA